jgi:hypothetical protein
MMGESALFLFDTSMRKRRGGKIRLFRICKKYLIVSLNDGYFLNKHFNVDF